MLNKYITNPFDELEVICRMRLWHYKLIPYLDRQRLLGQHREICALRGLGWGRKHSTVDYVFKYPYYKLYVFHELVMIEMMRRGYNADDTWWCFNYRGKRIGLDNSEFTSPITNEDGRYREHNKSQLKEWR